MADKVAGDAYDGRAGKDIETHGDISAAPLAWFARLCAQRRQMTAAMEDVAAAPDFVEPAYTVLVDWLKFGLFLHIRDCTDDLFPLLTSRAHKDDDFKAVMATLAADHDFTKAHVRRLMPRLEALHLVREPASSHGTVASGLRDLAHRERQHVAVLTKVILPIARLRLVKADVETLSTNMAARRQ